MLCGLLMVDAGSISIAGQQARGNRAVWALGDSVPQDLRSTRT